MPFKLIVKNAGAIPAVHRYFVEVTVESGVVKGGETAVVEGHPDKMLSIRSIALVGGRKSNSEIITLTVDRPAFAIEELIGQRLSDS